jgi:hypothetical protein
MNIKFQYVNNYYTAICLLFCFILYTSQANAQDEIILNGNINRISNIRIIKITPDSLYYKTKDTTITIPQSAILVYKINTRPAKDDKLLRKIYRKTIKSEKYRIINEYVASKPTLAISLDAYVYLPTKLTIQLNSKKIKNAFYLSYLNNFQSIEFNPNFSFEIGIKHYFGKQKGLLISSGYSHYTGAYEIYQTTDNIQLISNNIGQLNFATFEIGHYWRKLTRHNNRMYELGLNLYANVPLGKNTAQYITIESGNFQGVILMPIIRYAFYLSKIKK